MNKILLIIIAVFLLAGFGYILKQNLFQTMPSTDKLKVAATIYPLAEFAAGVGKDKIEIATIVPAGQEPHAYEPTPQDLIKIRQANIFIVNGAGLDPWAEKIALDLSKSKQTVLIISASISLITYEKKIVDPHFWLDPIRAQKEVTAIRNALTNRDPARANVYRKNADDYINQLIALDQEYAKGLTSCQSRDVVVSHATLNYLAQRYNLNVIPIAGPNPEEEPSPRQMAEIVQTIRQKKIGYIFFETLVSPRLAETLARATGSQTLIFNPIEGLTNAELKAGKNYLSLMKDNLAHLRIALACQ